MIARWHFTISKIISVQSVPHKNQISTFDTRIFDIMANYHSVIDLLNLDVAIIVCYRDREMHLKIFINYMNSFLISQNSSARIYVIEQVSIHRNIYLV